MKAALLLTILTLSATAIVAEAPSTLMVFAPEGALVTLSTSQGTQRIDSNVAHSLEAGPVELSVIHPDYESYTRSWKLVPGQQLVLIPQLRPSEGYRLSQKESLLSLRERVRSQREAYSLATLGVGVVALAGWATVGGLEWSLASKKTSLGEAQAAYRAASSDHAASLWSNIESIKTEITSLRTYETFTLAGSAGLSLGALVLWLLEPDTDAFDEAQKAME